MYGINSVILLDLTLIEILWYYNEIKLHTDFELVVKAEVCYSYNYIISI